MKTVTLFEYKNGSLFLHLEGDPVIWGVKNLNSNFLYDATILANDNAERYGSIFYSQGAWEDPSGLGYPEAGWEDEAKAGRLRPVAILQVEPNLNDSARRYLKTAAS